MDTRHTETITVDGAEYIANVYPDDGAESPRFDDNPGTRMHVWTCGYGGRTDVLVNELSGTDAGEALAHFIDLYGANNDDAVRRGYHKWAAITGSEWRLFTGTAHGYSQSDWHDCFVLVNADEWSDGADLALVASVEMDTYRAWRFGDVSFVTLTGPDGVEIDSLAGIYPDANGDYPEAIAYAREWAEADAETRRAEAARVGAGFIGII